MNKLGLGIAKRYSTSISPASFAKIETRWTRLPNCEQGVIADHLSKLQKGDWKKLTLDEKRAAYYIAYGAYGPRTFNDPGQKYIVAFWTGFWILSTFVLWRYWESVKPRTITDTPEWREAERQKAIEAKQNPFTGAYAQHLKTAEK